MPEVRIYEPGWFDRRWEKSLKRQNRDEREQLERALVDLTADLAACRHPHLDNRMQRWSPSRWHAPGKQQAHGHWYEYRLGDRKNRARVIVCHDPKEDVVYLVARTAIHDLERLQAVVGDF